MRNEIEIEKVTFFSSARYRIHTQRHSAMMEGGWWMVDG
jgi:hypothetical protein